jgi:hypothetical protein
MKPSKPAIMRNPMVERFCLASCLVLLITVPIPMSTRSTDAFAGLGVAMNYTEPLATRDAVPNPIFLTYPELGLTFKITVKNHDSQRSVQIHEFALNMTYMAENRTSQTQPFHYSFIYLSPLENFTFLAPVDFLSYAKNQSLTSILGNWTIWMSYEISKINWVFYGVTVETNSVTYGLLRPYPFRIEVAPYDEYKNHLPYVYCSQLGGIQCSASEGCSDHWVDCSDTAFCCIGHCVKLDSYDHYESLNNFIDLARVVLKDNWQPLVSILLSMMALLFGTGLLRRRRKKRRPKKQ